MNNSNNKKQIRRGRGKKKSLLQNFQQSCKKNSFENCLKETDCKECWNCGGEMSRKFFDFGFYQRICKDCRAIMLLKNQPVIVDIEKLANALDYIQFVNSIWDFDSIVWKNGRKKLNIDKSLFIRWRSIDWSGKKNSDFLMELLMEGF